MTRTRYLLFLTGVAVLSATATGVAQTGRPGVTVITGTLLGADGAPMPLAHVHAFPTFRPNKLARTVVDADGSFAIAVAGTGAYNLQFTGVDHDNARIPLVLTGSGTIALDVRLPRYAYTDTLGRVTAIGDWNHFDFGMATPLVRQPDGRYRLNVPVTADSLAYQFVGLEAQGGAGRSINGPRADWYAYDNGGDYRSVLRVRGGEAAIVLDPAQLERHTETLTVRFREERSAAARLYAMHRRWQELKRTYYDSARAARARHDSLRYDWAPIVAGRSAALARERDPILRQVLLLQLQELAAMGGKISRSDGERIVREVPPSSPIWAAGIFFPPGYMTRALAVAAGLDSTRDTAVQRASLAYLDRFIASQPDSELKIQGLENALFTAKFLKDEVRASDYYNRLVTDFPNSATTRYVRSQLSPNRVWRDSVAVPAFRVASLDDSAVTYTPAGFAGKILLIDFWATWCGPCIGDMPFLHAAHDSLASRGLEILSISIDNSAADVRRFRAGEWKMPWLHALMPGGMASPEARRLEIMYVPRVVLVGRDGRIIAVDTGLRGAELLPTLRRALEEHASQ